MTEKALMNKDTLTSYAYNASELYRASTVALTTLRQTILVNIYFNFNTKLSTLLCYSNNTYNASSSPAGDAKLGQSNTQSTISTRCLRAAGEQNGRSLTLRTIT